MREIKFKAWHKAEKVMCDVSIINFDQGAFLVGVKKGEDKIGDKYFIEAPTDGRFCNFDEFELLQYTGIKDKNGEYIYEGDILSSKYSTYPFAVTHENGYFEYNTERQKDYVEIIGNIYENPELLT